jgi:hypothetical protein
MLRNTALALAAASLLLGGGALTPAFANYSQCDEQPNAEGCPTYAAPVPWARRDRACLQPPRSGACDFPEIGKPVHGRSWHDGVLIVTSPFDTPPSFPVAGRDGGCLAPTSVTTLSGRDGSSAGLSVIPAKAGIQ